MDIHVDHSAIVRSRPVHDHVDDDGMRMPAMFPAALNHARVTPIASSGAVTATTIRYEGFSSLFEEGQ
ncbi:hypothetical protein KZ813_16675 [Sphingomonas sp. RHCKR7]|uniref:hypothetical protein n=1 Tax=Sphingomonas folli TaxID=2862497 RepID=UPI001CA5020B|nr:hypothetical protein [Sphingomonas folli]MBW6528480.1 hypothetical protein [Sphingomonas folli]